MNIKKYSVALLMVLFTTAAHASMWDFTYTDTIGDSSTPAVSVGDTAIVHLFANNGGPCIVNQSFGPSDAYGFTVDVGSYHATYSEVWPNFGLTTDSFGNVNSVTFYGTGDSSNNTDNLYGNFTGDFVYGSADFYNPNGYLFTFSDQTFNTVANWTVAPAATGVPEPSNLAIFALGLVGIALLGRRKKVRKG